MFGSTEDKAARRAERDEAMAAEKAKRQAEKERRRFERSPQGQARAAFQRGDGFYEVELNVRATGSLNSHGGSGSDVNAYGFPHRRNGGRTDALSVIESEGWRLEHTNAVFVQTGEDSRDKFMASGQRVAVRGEIVGLYLFRRCEANLSEAARSAPPVSE